MRTVEFLVVGGGVAGCALGVGLHRRGHDVLVVERQDHAPDAFAGEFLQPFAVQALEELGFGPALAARGGEASSELRFRECLPDGQVFGVAIPYPAGRRSLAMARSSLIGALREHAAAVLGDRLLLGARLAPATPSPATDGRWKVTDASGASHEVRARWTLAADGRGSRVRQLTGGPDGPANGRPAWFAPQELLVGAFAERHRSVGAVVDLVRTASSGTLWMIPIGGDRLRLGWNAPVRRVSKGDRARELGRVLDECQPLTGPLRVIDGSVRAASSQARWTGPAVRGSVVLVGDALQLTTPLGGQGMSFALRQAGWLLEAADRGMTAATLRDYASRVAAEHRHLGVLNTGIYHHFYARSELVRAVGRPIRAAWAEDEAKRARLGELFAGTWTRPLGAAELVHLLAGAAAEHLVGRVQQVLGVHRG